MMISRLAAGRFEGGKEPPCRRPPVAGRHGANTGIIAIVLRDLPKKNGRFSARPARAKVQSSRQEQSRD